MDEKIVLINNFRIGLVLYGVSSVLILLLLVSGIFVGVKFHIWNTTFKKIAYFSFLLILCLTLIFFIIQTSKYCADISDVQNENFASFTGTVIGYSYVREGNNPQAPISGKPIFINAQDTEKKAFWVGPTQIGKTYTLLYLTHTQLAVIIEEH